MTLKPKHRYIWPGDEEKKVNITFDLEELKSLQNIILERMKQAAEKENAIYKPHQELSQKLEYFITELEGNIEEG